MFIDTNVFLYAFGGPSPYREPCRCLLFAVADGRVVAATSTEVIQEVAHFYLCRRHPHEAERAVRAILEGIEVIHPVTVTESRRLLQLMPIHPDASAFDLLHLAVMQSAGLDTIVSADKDFDRFPGVRRIDPRDWPREGAGGRQS